MMYSTIGFLTILILVGCLLLVPRYSLGTKIEYNIGRLDDDDYYIDTIDNVKYALPFIGTAKIAELIEENLLAKLSLINGILYVVVFILINGARLFIETSPILFYLNSSLLCLFFLIEAIIAFKCARMFRCKIGVFSFFLPPVSMYLTSMYVGRYVRANKDEILGSFDGE